MRQILDYIISLQYARHGYTYWSKAIQGGKNKKEKNVGFSENWYAKMKETKIYGFLLISYRLESSYIGKK